MTYIKSPSVMLAVILAGCSASSSKGQAIELRLQPKAGTTYVYTTITTKKMDGSARVAASPLTKVTALKVLKSDAEHVQLEESVKDSSDGYSEHKSRVTTYSSRYGAERGQAAALYPQRAVSPGDTWSSAQPGAYRSVNLTLVSVETKGAKRLAKVTMTAEAGAGSGAAVNVSTLTSIDFVINVATGMFESSVTTEQREMMGSDGSRRRATTVSKMTLDRVE